MSTMQHHTLKKKLKNDYHIYQNTSQLRMYNNEMEKFKSNNFRNIFFICLKNFAC